MRAREQALLAAFGPMLEDGEAWLEERRERWVYGTPDEARAQLDAGSPRPGMERIMLQDFLPVGPRHVDLMGEELVGRA